eukprot:gnl/TRDRNA2_/TRDRNA2_177617_c0_seq2.p2 gnl/TRDRNA2_/TRDRNA2_177617_c0~~gnl/TRDRNA2_/TRDRNA2_177617_c0_seq2.p2  ORF type:complete len:363 (-),score=-20.09 gnl/TRDRNA2_/TRDRNA2_177617_c0_seq2:1513-2601(-)
MKYLPETLIDSLYTGGPFTISEDGCKIVCACGEKIKIINMHAGVTVRTLPGDGEVITALCLDNKSEYVCGFSRSLKASLWSIHTGRCILRFNFHKSPATDACFDSTGSLLAVSSADGTIGVFDPTEILNSSILYGHNGAVSQVLFHPRKSKFQIFSGGEDKIIRVWDYHRGECICKLKGHRNKITSLSVLPSGCELISAGHDMVVHVWDLQRGKHIRTIPMFEIIHSLKIIKSDLKYESMEVPKKIPRKSPVRFVTAGHQYHVRVWDYESSTCIYGEKLGDTAKYSDNFESHSTHFLSHIYQVSRENTLVASSTDGKIFYLDLQESQRKIIVRLNINGEECYCFDTWKLFDEQKKIFNFFMT